jgi:dTDP-glucose pyrophosphorylase
MSEINIVIPMAGAGRRFSEMGYTKPKPFIDVLGKPMICHVLDNLKIDGAKYILLTRKEHFEAEQDTVNYILTHYNTEFILIDQLTEGASCTVLHAHRLIDNDAPLLIANSDQIVDIDIRDYLQDSQARGLDGSVLCFEDSDSKWSYAKVNEDGFITTIKEKVVISKHATVGIYYFSHGTDFVKNAIDMIVRNDRVNNEFYVAPVYNYGIAKGGKYGIYNIEKEHMHGTGTPEDLDKYIAFKQEPVHA